MSAGNFLTDIGAADKFPKTLLCKVYCFDNFSKIFNARSALFFSIKRWS